MSDEEEKNESKEEEKKEETKPETSSESKPEPEETAKEDEKEDEATEKAVEEVKEANQSAKKAEKEIESKKLKVSGKLLNIIKDIESLSVLELADLVKALEDKFGVSAAAPAAVAVSAAPAGGGDDEGAEEKSTFNVVLTDGGEKKISVIKAIREIVPTLGLKEAKDLVDAAPKSVLEGANKDDANEAKKKLEEAGGKVDLK